MCPLCLLFSQGFVLFQGARKMDLLRSEDQNFDEELFCKKENAR